MKPSNVEHVSHIAFNEASEAIKALMRGQSVDEALVGVGTLFMTGVEFGIRLAQRYPDDATDALDALIEKFGAHGPREIREREMDESIRKVFEGCTAGDEPL